MPTSTQKCKSKMFQAKNTLNQCIVVVSVTYKPNVDFLGKKFYKIGIFVQGFCDKIPPNFSSNVFSLNFIIEFVKGRILHNSVVSTKPFLSLTRNLMAFMYWGRQCLWTNTLCNRMQVTNMLSYNHNR